MILGDTELARRAANVIGCFKFRAPVQAATASGLPHARADYFLCAAVWCPGNLGHADRPHRATQGVANVLVPTAAHGLACGAFDVRLLARLYPVRVVEVVGALLLIRTARGDLFAKMFEPTIICLLQAGGYQLLGRGAQCRCFRL